MRREREHRVIDEKLIGLVRPMQRIQERATQMTDDRVLMACLDGPEFVGTFWGAIKIGAVPVPVNTLLRRQDYAYLLRLLSGFKAKTASDLDGTMTMAAQPLREEEIVALVHYMASLANR